MDRVKYIILKIIYCVKRLFIFIFKQPFYNSNKSNKDNSFCVDYKNYVYTIQPHEFYIKNNIDKLLDLSLSFFSKNNYTLNIGIEIEFYLLNKIDLANFYNSFNLFVKENNIDIISIEEERGDNQFEIKFNIYRDIIKLIEDYNKTKFFLLDNFNVSFEDMPIDFDAGSALQVNLSITDNYNNNLYARNKEQGIESQLMYNSIAGLLETTNLFLPCYLSQNKNTERFDDNINNILYNKGKMPAPTYISWGINNRTCSIRIPIPKNITDKNNYFLEDEKNRRIEFRVPSSNSDLKLVIYSILNSVAFGIYNNINPISSTYNNVLLHHNDYEKIELKYYSFEDYYNILKVLID